MLIGFLIVGIVAAASVYRTVQTFRNLDHIKRMIKDLG